MKLRISLLQKFFRLDVPERRFLVRAWGTLYLVDLALRLLPFETVLHWCKHGRGQAQNDARLSLSLTLSRCARLVGLAGRYSLLDITCLKEALVMVRLMGRLGVRTTLRIGVARSNGALTAHAWLEQDGRVVFNRATMESYAPLHPCHHEAS